jgi:hypothetical protein
MTDTVVSFEPDVWARRPSASRKSDARPIDAILSATPAPGKYIFFPGSAPVFDCRPGVPFLNDPEANEHGDFGNIHQECKDDCPQKRFSHND